MVCGLRRCSGMRWSIVMCLGPVLALAGCSSSSSPECGGCARPPVCNPDGTAPDPYPMCSCGCLEGDVFDEGVCNENGCIDPSDSPFPDAGTSMTCEGGDAEPPAEPVEETPAGAWNDATEELETRNDSSEDPFPLTVDPAVCSEGKWLAWLPLGSAFVHVHAREDGDCEVWLGGETENPMYDGSPTQYCRFPPSCAPVTAGAGRGGPAFIDSPYCVAL